MEGEPTKANDIENDIENDNQIHDHSPQHDQSANKNKNLNKNKNKIQQSNVQEIDEEQLHNRESLIVKEKDLQDK
eukprot:CAMPEP_0116975034 /NCGR_PEP_ID=MMETSP0467-20121206/55546_1 /TAXON_ID=283647 /ORGANISM="Mesodinium pulex, Strain SPMC105" /LENGTH=74 /DNA_ID=CAMNT_0004667337 /DNA_START=219 /DNA_END=443 /DNA_ORIENTATION=-